MRGHEGPVVHAAFSPDDQQLATAGEDGTARLWALPADPSSSSTAWFDRSQVAYSNDGQRYRVFTPMENSFWETEVGKKIAALHQGNTDRRTGWGHTGFSPDGRRVLIEAAGKPLAWVHDTATGVQIATLQPRKPSSPFASMSPLKGMPLTRVMCQGTAVKDLSPLSDAPLEVLRADGSGLAGSGSVGGGRRALHRSIHRSEPLALSDLEPPSGMPLGALEISWTKVKVISPLRGLHQLAGKPWRPSRRPLLPGQVFSRVRRKFPWLKGSPGKTPANNTRHTICPSFDLQETGTPFLKERNFSK